MSGHEFALLQEILQEILIELRDIKHAVQIQGVDTDTTIQTFPTCVHDFVTHENASSGVVACSRCGYVLEGYIK